MVPGLIVTQFTLDMLKLLPLLGTLIYFYSVFWHRYVCLILLSFWLCLLWRKAVVVTSVFLDCIIIQVKSHTVIFATGATAKRLRLPREDEFWSRGISACAICDGASPLFKGQVLAVIGGGDTATEEALYLTKYARHVHLLVRRDQLRASKAMQDRCVWLKFVVSYLWI